MLRARSRSKPTISLMAMIVTMLHAPLRSAEFCTCDLGSVGMRCIKDRSHAVPTCYISPQQARLVSGHVSPTCNAQVLCILLISSAADYLCFLPTRAIHISPLSCQPWFLLFDSKIYAGGRCCAAEAGVDKL